MTCLKVEDCTVLISRMHDVDAEEDADATSMIGRVLNDGVLGSLNHFDWIQVLVWYESLGLYRIERFHTD